MRTHLKKKLTFFFHSARTIILPDGTFVILHVIKLNLLANGNGDNSGR